MDALAEINELNVLDRCHHFYESEKIYERLHPDTKQDDGRSNQYKLYHFGIRWYFV